MLETISLQKTLIFLLFVVNSISPGFGIASHIRYFSTKAMNDLDEIMIAGSVGGAGGGTHPWSGPHGTTCSNDGHHGHHWHTLSWCAGAAFIRDKDKQVLILRNLPYLIEKSHG